MNSTVLIKKELRENKWPILVGLIILAVFAFVNAYTYDYINKLLNSSQNANTPDLIKQSLNQMADFKSYIWYSWFGKSYYQVIMVISIVMGMGLVAGEVSKDTITFLLTKPFGRGKVYTVKYLVGAVELFILGLLSSLIQYLAVIMSGKEYSFTKVLLGVISSFPGLLVIFTLAVLLSTLFNDRLKAGLLAGVITLVSSIPGFFPDYEKYSIFKYITSAQVLKGDGITWTSFLVLLVLAAVLFMAGLQIFKKKQF